MNANVSKSKVRGTQAPLQSPLPDIQRLQAKLAKRLSLIFLFPLAGLIAIGVYAYDLNSRLAQLEVGSKVASLERWVLDKNFDLAISEYEKLVARYPTPELLTRLGAFYYQRAEDHQPMIASDQERAIEMLKKANALHVERQGKEFWLANRTLAYIQLVRGESYWDQAVEAGEKAIAENPYDDESYNNLAWIYAVTTNPAVKDLGKAEQYAQRAVQLTRGQDASMLDTLRTVYVVKGGNDQRIDKLDAEIAALQDIPSATHAAAQS